MFHVFQSTFPRGERLLGVQHTVLNIAVSIHVPARGTTLTWMGINNSNTEFQSTFPRGERPIPLRGLVLAPSVSIHVPARGTTTKFLRGDGWVLVSIHVPARGTTLRIVLNLTNTPFQSTFPRGERHDNWVSYSMYVVGFNPRSREGNDLSSQQII